MSRLLSVDPGIRGCGVALFVDDLLGKAEYVRNTCPKGNRAAEAESMAANIYYYAYKDLINDLAVEWPRIYASRIREGSSKEDPNDLLALAGVVSAVAGKLNVWSTSYCPSEWKGQLTKEACHERIKSRLTPIELAILEDASKAAGKTYAHNVWDAVGIGLHHLGRLGKKRVIL